MYKEQGAAAPGRRINSIQCLQQAFGSGNIYSIRLGSRNVTDFRHYIKKERGRFRSTSFQRCNSITLFSTSRALSSQRQRLWCLSRWKRGRLGSLAALRYIRTSTIIPLSLANSHLHLHPSVFPSSSICFLSTHPYDRQILTSA